LSLFTPLVLRLSSYGNLDVSSFSVHIFYSLLVFPRSYTATAPEAFTPFMTSTRPSESALPPFPCLLKSFSTIFPEWQNEQAAFDNMVGIPSLFLVFSLRPLERRNSCLILLQGQIGAG